MLLSASRNCPLLWRRVPSSFRSAASSRPSRYAHFSAVSASGIRSVVVATRASQPHTRALWVSQMLASRIAMSAFSYSPRLKYATPAPSHVDEHGRAAQPWVYTSSASSGRFSATSRAPSFRNTSSGQPVGLLAMAAERAPMALATCPVFCIRMPSRTYGRVSSAAATFTADSINATASVFLPFSMPMRLLQMRMSTVSPSADRGCMAMALSASAGRLRSRQNTHTCRKGLTSRRAMPSSLAACASSWVL